MDQVKDIEPKRPIGSKGLRKISVLNLNTTQHTRKGAEALVRRNQKG